MDQAAARKILMDLVKREDLKNKICNDCSNPNPQWASLSFAVFLCLQCAGTHRGFGVHISFVRSISMDTWQDEQIKRMQLGGNAPFREFMESYTPAEQGGYSAGQSAYDTYHCWAATQYREKLDATLAGKPWTQAAPPEGTSASNGSSSPSRPSSAQGLRKSRASGRSATGSSLRNESPSLSNHSTPRLGSPSQSPAPDQKTANENYFASLGQANASRSTDLPPSQGGKYQGFGSTPTPPPGLQNPAFGLSSANVPTLGELQENPMAALSKGWSLFSAAVVGASRVVNENIIQPGVEKVTDPNLQASVRGYMTEAQKRAATLGSSANEWSKHSLGVDVADSIGSVTGRLSNPERSGYGQLAMDNDAETSALYHDDDDLFHEYRQDSPNTSHGQAPSSTAKPAQAKPAAKDGWDDEWKDF
ncbi:hypothetical protein HGRIS_009315 [Hohenbuehelia grisea]|uniref:Arf-GAP domain-containing protein n=1 Tax=Hohenbuehelia grisea TaxID=104357 RepID=A0ABR3J0R8_9AGAR